MPFHSQHCSFQSPQAAAAKCQGAGRLFITECTEPICECFAKCLIQGVPSIKLVQTSVSHTPGDSDLDKVQRACRREKGFEKRSPASEGVRLSRERV